jgi:cytochrome b subunit of formate dehydrogenase
MFTCASCHQSATLQDKRLFPRPEAVPHFYESVHAKGLLIDGLNVSPSCNDCHGTHDILNSGDPRSPVYKSNVYKTCGNCHTKVEETYKKSIHVQLVESGDKRGPVCTDCHESHEIVAPDKLAFKQYSDQKCGQCHEDKMERYHETFHGKATMLGSVNVATCYDCHGHHDILPASNENSYIHPDNKVETCSKCHTGVNYNFANYIAHADHMDRENYPMLYYTFLGMTLLVIGVFVFFSFHTLLWAGRTASLFLRDSKQFRAAKLKVKKADLQYVRFTPLERSLHVIMIISFITLAFSGIPIKFFMTGWAQSLMHIIGGIDNARYMHRFAAFMLVSIFLIHLFILTKKFIPKIKTLRDPKTNKFSFRIIKDKVLGPDSLVPHLQDVKDFWAHQKWFFGKGPQPKFERWTYWEKFDYFAVFWGVIIIGLSGLIMWFPTIFTLFMPGWIINLALIIHSDEALLATGFIFVFHFFNTHFRIEKFPMDTVIFSGKISEEEFLEERGAWYERLKKTEKLGELKEKAEWEGWQPIVKTFGFIAFGMGIILAFGIFTAMFYRLIIG